jgi:large subunit ribosomal protein L6
MSRIGKLPVALDNDVKASISNGFINISGPKGSLKAKINNNIELRVFDDKICVLPLRESASSLSMWGTTRSIINNMVTGVKQGFKIDLELVGVGYRVAIKDNFINLNIGKSHSVRIFIPEGIKAVAPKANQISLEGFDKELIGQFAALIIKQRPTEPFKGKGIKFKDKFVKKKEGKKN